MSAAAGTAAGTAALNLSPFGWDNVTIPENLADICACLPKWSQLKTLRNPQLVGTRNVHFPHTYFHDVDGTPFMPAFEKGVLHNRGGGYATIYRGTRALYKPVGDRTGMVHLDRKQGFEEVCVKEVTTRADPDEPEEAFEEDIKAILYEAYLHALLSKFLESTPLKTTVPVLHEVVATTISGLPPEDPSDIDSVWMTMEFIEGATLEKHLQRTFLPSRHAENDKTLLDILLQLAHLLGLLQSSLRFNHRDMKINNVYVRYHPAGDAWGRGIPLSPPAAAAAAATIGPLWRTRNDLVLIDFGFSCIACGTGFVNPRATLLGAGSYFRPEHDCMKTGRDLAQFIYSLHCSFPLQSYISPPLFAALHGAVTAIKDGRRVDMWRGFDLSGNPSPVLGPLPIALPYHKGVYNFLREGDADVPGCAPTALLATLAPFATAVMGGGSASSSRPPSAAATAGRH
jgi:serine/threonine protein kinase